MTYNRRSVCENDYEPSKAVMTKIRRAVEERQVRELAHLIQGKHNWTCYCDYCLGHLKPKWPTYQPVMAWNGSWVPLRAALASAVRSTETRSRLGPQGRQSGAEGRRPNPSIKEQS